MNAKQRGAASLLASRLFRSLSLQRLKVHSIKDGTIGAFYMIEQKEGLINGTFLFIFLGFQSKYQ